MPTDLQPKVTLVFVDGVCLGPVCLPPLTPEQRDQFEFSREFENP